MKSAADLIRRAADDYRALGQEHTTDPRDRAVYELVELTLREVANALEAVEQELVAA